jgi:hypothetical protein
LREGWRGHCERRECDYHRRSRDETAGYEAAMYIRQQITTHHLVPFLSSLYR